MTFRPGEEIVRFLSGAVHSGRVSMPPEKTSWKISTKGMMVMAAVVLRHRVEIHSAIMSEAKVIRKTVMPKSSRNQLPKSGLHSS